MGDFSTTGKRYLGLVGIAIESEYYRNEFHYALEALKQSFFPHSPDEPLILHREDIYNRRHAFGILAEPELNDKWEQTFQQFTLDAKFHLFGAVIDKQYMSERYGNEAQHPYHLCLTFLLERYKGFLHHNNHTGDVLAESRGGNADILLKDVYTNIWQNGNRYNTAESFQSVLTSKEIKIKPKKANIGGLQLADLLAHPITRDILCAKGQIDWADCFGKRLTKNLQNKYVNRFGKKFFGEIQEPDI